MKNIIDLFKITTIKARIILIFSLITVLLVGTVARISYSFVKTIYLEQIAEQVKLLNSIIAKDLNLSYLDFIESDKENLAFKYYEKKLNDYYMNMQLNNTFLFNTNFEVLVSTGESISSARLKINRSEIYQLKTNEAVTSLPFKGSDNQWYLWGFYRLSNQYYLGIQESADRLNRLDYLSILFLAIGAIGILITVAAAWLLARSIANPINSLVQFSGEIGQGNFKTTEPKAVHGELAILNNALIKMRKNLLNQQEEKEKLLAQIAHEIRNPLGGIELLAGLIREQLDEKSQNAEYINKIIEEVQGLKAQVTEYLQYSRPMPAQLKDLTIDEIITDIKKIYRNQIGDSAITFSRDDKIINIKFDPNHFRQVMINLINNSLGVKPEAGKIEVKFSQNGTSKIVSISDNGPGIDDEDLDHVFEPFFTKRSEGIGLGLAICQKLCNENNARIAVKNNSEAGCTFSIII